VQQALIVDDSKTARVSLRKLLDKHQITSALVECAEDALEYLQENRPSMIFMDHMMPGMDGFDAVKAIKADPEKAEIPIVMYTTQQGDIYVGQARALGAADILSKPANDQALSEVLARINQLPGDDVSQEIPSLVKNSTVKSSAAISSIGAVTEEEKEPESIAQPVMPKHVVPITESYETINSDPDQPSFFNVSWRQVAMLFVWLAPIIWLLVLYLPADKQRNQLLDERKALFKSIEWAINQSESYDYGDAPLSGRRLEVLRGLVSHLAVSGFKGTIRIEGHTGEFCLTEVALDEGGLVNMLPSAELSLSQCTTIGAPAAKTMELSGRSSEEFEQFLQTSPLLQSSGINVEVVRHGASYPKYEYPQIQESTTVGDWNTVALSNNRVNFVLVPK
jgi:CheY-like chemotaxis protein